MQAVDTSSPPDISAPPQSRQRIESDHFRVKRPMPRVGGFSPSAQHNERSEGSKPCCGYGKGLTLPARGRCASRTRCYRSVSVSQGLIKPEKRAGLAPRAVSSEFAISPDGDYVIVTVVIVQALKLPCYNSLRMMT